jgi:hypothetical protein
MEYDKAKVASSSNDQRKMNTQNILQEEIEA